MTIFKDDFDREKKDHQKVISDFNKVKQEKNELHRALVNMQSEVFRM